jgi:hypothetical protein
MPPLGIFFGWLLLGEQVVAIDLVGILPAGKMRDHLGNQGLLARPRHRQGRAHPGPWDLW